MWKLPARYYCGYYAHIRFFVEQVLPIYGINQSKTIGYEYTHNVYNKVNSIHAADTVCSSMCTYVCNMYVCLRVHYAWRNIGNVSD